MSQTAGIDDAMEKGKAGTFDITPESFQQPSSSSTQATVIEPSKDSNTKEYITQFSPKPNFWALHWIQNLFRKKPQNNENNKRISIVRTFNECPAGYPRLAAFLDSDENFMLYRRFGFLQARVLLYKQDELRELESKLDKLDRWDEKTRPKMLKSRDKDDAEDETRKELIRVITKNFKEYAELLKTARELAGFNRAPARDYESVTNYFNINDPLCNPESYIFRKEDIITLKPGREASWLDALVEKTLQKSRHPWLQKWFCSEDLLQKTDPTQDKVVLYSRERINLVVSMLITLIILTLIIIPVYVLWKLARSKEFTNKTTATIICVLLVCTLVFSGVLSLFTRAKRHEILAAAAGYCAVLVVFIGNIGEISSSR